MNIYVSPRLLLPAIIWLSCAAAVAQDSHPDSILTPGLLNPAVTPDTIDQTICRPAWIKQINPPQEYLDTMKIASMLAYDFPIADWDSYAEDYRVPLALGGDPRQAGNLWPRPKNPQDGWGADQRSELLEHLHRQVCSHIISLADAQAAFTGNWHSAYWRDVKGVHLPLP
jgi:hypothetical protein